MRSDERLYFRENGDEKKGQIMNVYISAYVAKIEMTSIFGWSFQNQFLRFANTGQAVTVTGKTEGDKPAPRKPAPKKPSKKVRHFVFLYAMF